MRPGRPFDLLKALSVLGLSKTDMDQAVQSVPNGPDCWTQRTQAFHKMIQSARKRLQRQLHPDVVGDDNPAALEQCARVNSIADDLLNIQIMPPRPQPRIIVQHVNIGGSFWGDATSTTTSFYGGNSGYVKVNFW